MAEGASQISPMVAEGWVDSGLFREAIAIASGPVREDEREPDQCYWACGSLNRECDHSGQDIMTVYRRCNDAYTEMVEGGALLEDLPECALVEIRSSHSAGEKNAS